MKKELATRPLSVHGYISPQKSNVIKINFVQEKLISNYFVYLDNNKILIKVL